MKAVTTDVPGAAGVGHGIKLETSVICEDCGANLPAGITVRKIFGDEMKVIGYHCYRACRKPKPIMLPPDILKSVKAIVEYNFEDEKSDYESYGDNKPESHIYLDLVKVREFLEGER